MQEVKLVHYMSKWPVLARLVFPRDNERQLNVNEFKNKILFEERSENEECANFLDQYLEMIEERQEGKVYRIPPQLHTTSFTGLTIASQ